MRGRHVLIAAGLGVGLVATGWVMWDLGATTERQARQAAEAAELLRSHGYTCSKVRTRRTATDAFGSRYFIVSCNAYGPFFEMVRMADGEPLTFAE